MKIYFDTIGCRLNQSEIETLARHFRSAGHDVVGYAELADLAVVNTCTVTSKAASDSRARIRAAARAGAQEIVATGCWATLEPEKARKLPKVRLVVSNADKMSIAADLLNLPVEIFDEEPLAREPLPGLRARTRAFIKVQDGCDNNCTFCITTVARGEGRSIPLADVLADVQAAVEGGTKEVVLTGVHLGSWGQDFDPPNHLRDLVQAILAETEIPRLRLSSLEPWDLDADFFSLWENPRLCRHLHLPLQSGSSSVLKRMLRKTSPESFMKLVAAARSVMPDVAITTDVIAGFPGETEDEFSETLEFVQQCQFSGGHVFTYSPRPGTPAARMKSQVPREIRKIRSAALRALFDSAAHDYEEMFIGQTKTVLWESIIENGPEGWLHSGLTDNYLRVRAYSQEPRWNEIDPVRLSLHEEGGILGSIQ